MMSFLLISMPLLIIFISNNDMCLVGVHAQAPQQANRPIQFSPPATPAFDQSQRGVPPNTAVVNVDPTSSSTSSSTTSTSSTSTTEITTDAQQPTDTAVTNSTETANGGGGSASIGDTSTNNDNIAMATGGGGDNTQVPPSQQQNNNNPRQFVSSAQPTLNGQTNGLATSNASAATISTFLPANMPQIANIRAQCRQDGMTVLVEFNNNPFNGVIYSKGAFYTPGCVYIQPNSQSTSYTFEVPMNACGTVQNTDTQTNRKYFSNTIIFQLDPLYQEIWDQARTIRCEWTTRFEETITFTPYNADMLQTEEIPFSGDTLTTSFAIQQGRGPFAPLLTDQLVRIGDTLTLVVFVNGDTGFDIAVLDCYASDSRQRSVLQLTDQGGCPLRPKILMPWQKTFETRNTGASVIAYAFVNAFRFPDDMVVNLRCNIAVCKNGCPETCTQQQGGGGPQQFNLTNTSPGGATGAPLIAGSTSSGGIGGAGLNSGGFSAGLGTANGGAGSNGGGFSAGLGTSNGGTNVVRVPPNGGGNDPNSNRVSSQQSFNGGSRNGGGGFNAVGGGYGGVSNAGGGGGRNNNFFFNRTSTASGLGPGINLSAGNFGGRNRGGPNRSIRSGDGPSRFARRRRQADETTMQSIPKMSDEMLMKKKMIVIPSAPAGGQRRVRAFEQRIVVASPDQFQFNAPRNSRALPLSDAQTEYANYQNALQNHSTTPFAASQQQLLQQQQGTFSDLQLSTRRRSTEQNNIIDAEPALFDVTKKLICVNTLLGSMISVVGLALLSVATGLAAAFYLRLPLSKRGQ